MPDDYLYHYKRTRKQRSALYIRMGLVCLLYIAGMYGVDRYTDISISDQSQTIMAIAFLLSAITLFSIAWWHIKHPATYEAYITHHEFVISYPGSDIWSFKVNIEDIVKVEHRKARTGGGESLPKTGILMANNDFHEITMNYGNNINHMFKALKTAKPSITFPKTINKE